MGLFFLGISIWLFPIVPLPLSCEVIQLRCFQFNGEVIRASFVLSERNFDSTRMLSLLC
ncbi:hypothetical protein RchiOBHm_Chr6g0272681 [Rosa chinensis]|uniref:Uncharacterized protein n=1 Tax=Rosa chinensis TaxID=74649 RepID=A0A2P6PRC3_ROSCH|nr:hypothetical protein RchiOBHm_Chr6g0272681 [Rosa chinensis]